MINSTPDTFVHLLTQMNMGSPEAYSLIAQKVQTLAFSKNEMLVSSHTPCKGVYLIRQGIARNFFLTEGKEITYFFG